MVGGRKIVGYRKANGGHLLILVTFVSLPVLVGWKSKRSGQQPKQEGVLKVWENQLRELSGPRPLHRVEDIVSKPRIWNRGAMAISLESQPTLQIMGREGLLECSVLCVARRRDSERSGQDRLRKILSNPS